MRRLGGAATLMQINSNREVLNKVTFLLGDSDIVKTAENTAPKGIFDDTVISFLNDVSREIMKNKAARLYSDVVTFAFWIRKTSMLKMKTRFFEESAPLRLGRGIAFHIAPSNVPVNFAYSLVSGLLCGNINIVRVPSKQFPQVDILADAFAKTLDDYEELKPFVVLVRYMRDKEINDFFSSVCDVRIVWGGNNTIAELRKSPLPPRSTEITFADRFSIAVIDSDAYMDSDDKRGIAENFYNDTYFSDQNACTSPRLVVWMGSRIKEAKELFWKEEHALAAKKYQFQDIQGVNKLTTFCLAAMEFDCIRKEEGEDNLLFRINNAEIPDDLMDYRDNSGYFYEYDCKDILELRSLCNNMSCQTIGYIGDSSLFEPLIKSGIKGVDRVVPIGRTMDFDLIWDGYNLPALMTRTVVIE